MSILFFGGRKEKIRGPKLGDSMPESGRRR
jgi:hypothetical protein